MKTHSPLRYPGGKASLAGLISAIRRLNALGDTSVAEPFAGGAGASLGLLFLEGTDRIVINDADNAVFDLWWTLTHRPRPFLELLMNAPLTIAEWRRQRDIYRMGSRSSRLKRGFATFYLNRCNRSGIIVNGGPIGGVRQQGKWKLDARFNRDELLRRCARIGEYRGRIEVSCEDGIEFIKQQSESNTFMFIDPPYYNKGPLLYLNLLDDSYHTHLARVLKDRADLPWVLTYDDCPQIRKLYRGWSKIRPFSLRYSAHGRGLGREVMIVPKWMRLPTSQGSKALAW